jgi:hypothetical protein
MNERTGREPRLVVLVLVVSVAVLFVLARFRFPDAENAPPIASPLDALATRAVYDDLAGAIVGLLKRVGASIELVQVSTDAAAARAGELAVQPAVRIRSDLLLLHVPAGMHPVAPAGQVAPLDVVALDPRRQIALVRVVGASGDAVVPRPLEGFGGFVYVAAIETAPGGPSARPMFIGRVDPVADDRWSVPPLVIGGEPVVSAGTLVFAIDGRFIGLVLTRDAGRVIVPSAALAAAAEELAGRGAS